MSGFNATSFQNDAWLDLAVSTLVNEAWWNEANGIAEHIGENETPSGPNITIPIVYTQTDNTEAMSAYNDPMAAASTADGHYFYYAKTSYQGTPQTWKILQQYEKGFGQNPKTSLTSDSFAQDLVLQQLKARISAALAAEVEAQVDEANTLGDGALTRATYDQVSSENDDGGELTMKMVEDELDDLASTDHGSATDPANQIDMVMPRNQARRFSRLGAASAGVSFSETNFQMIVDASSGAPIDAGRLSRTKTFEGVKITIAPMTTTTILFLRRGTNRVYNWLPLSITDKSAGVAAAQKLWQYLVGYNWVCVNQKWNGKISGLTA